MMVPVPDQATLALDPDRCYRAARSRDARFDGWFYVAVRTTGIYCRPSCPAITPKRHNVEFHPSAAAAQQRGFRACKRCRPDAAPGSPEWDRRGDLVARAIQRHRHPHRRPRLPQGAGAQRRRARAAKRPRGAAGHGAVLARQRRPDGLPGPLSAAGRPAPAGDMLPACPMPMC